MPIVPERSVTEYPPPMPDQKVSRFLCVAAVDLGMVTSTGPWGTSTNHKVKFVHETSFLIDKEGSSYHGKPYLLHTHLNLYYGKEKKRDGTKAKKVKIVDFIEKHIKRDMTPEEKGWEDGTMFDVESLVGKVVKGYIETKDNGWQFASSWQYDVDDDSKPCEPWEKRSDWKPREAADAGSFNYGAKAEAGKPASPPDSAETFFD